MTKRKMRRAGRGLATAAITGGLAFLFVTERGERPAAAEARLPLPRIEPPTRGPASAEWTRMTTQVIALRVALDATGAHTHDNWIFFRLPFDSRDRERVRDVRVEPSATIDPDVAAIRIGMSCAPYAAYGPIGTWAGYTAGAVGPTLPFAEHPTPPTDDPRIYGLNVPSRVANYVSCNWQKANALRDPATWRLDVSWEER